MNKSLFRAHGKGSPSFGHVFTFVFFLFFSYNIQQSADF